MTASAEAKISAQEFFSWAAAQEKGRFELLGGHIVAMAPEISDHARAKLEVTIALREAIQRAGVPCEAFVDSLGVQVDDETVFEPDALVNCGERVPPKSLKAPSPIVVVEVISPSSQRKDTGKKLIDYFRVPGIQHYLVIDLERKLVLHHKRRGPGTIVTEIVHDGLLRLDPPGIEIAVGRIFPQVA